MVIRKRKTENPFLCLLKTVREKSESELAEEGRRLRDLKEQQVQSILSSAEFRASIAQIARNSCIEDRFRH